MKKKLKRKLKLIELQLDWYSRTPVNEIGTLGAIRFLRLLREYDRLIKHK